MTSLSFYFTENVPPDDLISDLMKTNKLNGQQFDDVLDILFSFLTNTSSPEELESALNEFASSNGVNDSPLKSMVKALVIIGNAMVKKNLSTTQINSDLTKLKINESHIQMFCQKWEGNITGLYSALLTSNQRGCKLVNMDWKFGVTASSSEFQQVGNCFLQMKFTTENEDMKKDTFYLEMTLPQFYDFMHEVDKAKINLQGLTVS